MLISVKSFSLTILENVVVFLGFLFFLRLEGKVKN